jgi:PAS domain S-box-containing protein
MLRGLVAIVAMAVGVVYILIDWFTNIAGNFHWYGGLIVCSVVAFWLNKTQRYSWASITLILLSNGVIYIFASSESAAGGVFFFFLTTGLCTLVLFGYRNRSLAFLLVGVSYVIALIAYLGFLPARSFNDYGDQYTQINFIANFTISYLVSILMIHFSIQLHHDIEANLRTSEQSLLLTSEELKRSRERFQLAVEGSRAAIYEWNKQTGFIYLSPYYKKILGYNVEDLQDFTMEKYFELVHPEDLPKIRSSFERHLRNHEPYQSEMRLRTKGGSYKWVNDSGVSKFNEKGEQSLIVGSIVDIDERKMAEQQIRLQNELLAKANEELDRFVYSASHDLRAPLSSLLGLISIAEKTDNSTEVMQCLDMMKKRVLTMENFIKEITDYSRNSRLGVEKKPVNVLKLVQGIIETLKFTNGAERISLRLNIGSELEFETDANRLKVIVNNLIANAIKYHDYSKPNPFIEISAWKKNNENVLVVRDNGQGILKEHQDQIFNMFYRASENSEGSGLGLYIVKETASKLSGEIDVESQPGEGSEFTLSLPVF